MKTLLTTMAAAAIALVAIPAQADTVLHVMSWQPAYVDSTDYWKKTIDGFEAENPGVKVESNFIAFAQYLPALTAMIASDTLPDVFNGGTKTGELGRSGHLVNFKDVFDDKFFAQYGRRQRVFCASLADVFDNAVPAQWRIELMKLIEQTPNLDWLLLTKRIGNAAEMLEKAVRATNHGRWGWRDNVFANVWIGATVVNQEEADRDIPKLLATPAAIRAFIEAHAV